MQRVVLREFYTFSQADCVVESILREDGSPKDLYMKGIFVQGGVRNHNGRIYPVHEIQRAVNQLNDRIRAGESVLGAADHPEELNITIKDASHVIETMWMDGPNGLGKLRVLNTPAGQLVKTLLTDGVKLGVSSRGSGNVDNSGNVSQFDISTVDIVARPSAPNAYPTPVYEMFTQGVKNGRVIENLAHAAQHDPRARDFLQQEVRKAQEDLVSFIRSLKA